MGKTEKRINKWLIGLVIGGAIVGGITTTKKGKSLGRRVFVRLKKGVRFLRRGLREIKKTAGEKNVKK